ncbi:cytidine/deoxycytidylate deaminase-like protein [Rhizobium sp. PP-F2F-G38]|nr:cytidine/deoxycytidylate deaminase-like protein [Rhizobium sp. PP-WC-1G-195]PYE99896.1 cytidine/deoxycytidylate deaminase-like protein [Rhizobium sp. PP-F2F-G38]
MSDKTTADQTSTNPAAIDRVPARPREAKSTQAAEAPGNPPSASPPLTEADARLLRQTFDIARRAQTHGNMPFGALLTGPEGEVLIEMENGYFPDLDATAHAERLLATEASKRYREPFLATCTMYSSAEPCAMCAGAIYWTGIGRVVYGLSEHALKTLTGDHPDNPTMDLPSRTVFAAGQKAIAVVGPCLEDEAGAVHVGAW